MPTETIIHTLRHGHTEYNAYKRYAGSIDIPLSEKGIQDCRIASRGLATYHFDVVVTSTMKRAIETAKLMTDGNIPVVQTPLCNERDFGIMEGHTWDEVIKFDPPILMINVGNDLHTVNPKGGEPFEDVWERAKKFRRFLFRYYEGQSILVVSHGVFLQMFHGLIRRLSCIESLANYPSNLELASFCYLGNHLVEETVEKLIRTGSEPRF